MTKTPLSNQDQLPTASVVICAYTEDRWTMLEAAIASAQLQTYAPQAIVVVIDHNPSLFARARAAVPEWTSAGGPPLTVVENAFDGHLGSARNTGVAQCGSDVVAFLDDDAAADPTWLETIVGPYVDASVHAVGGAPLPVYETKRPRWLPEQMNWVFGCAYDGLPTVLAPTTRLIGASMSVRRSSLAAIDGFHSDDHDDMVMCHQLAMTFPDGAVLFEPRAVVRHNVVAARVTWSYFWNRCFKVNRSKARELHRLGNAGDTTEDRSFVLGAIGRGLSGAGRDLTHGDLFGIVRFSVLLIGIGTAAVGFAVGQLDNRRAS